jgi:hypothetical protein
MSFSPPLSTLPEAPMADPTAASQPLAKSAKLSMGLPHGYASLLFVDGPSRNDLHQGNASTCSPFAAAMAMTNSPRGQRQLMHIIRQRVDGDFEVRLGGEIIHVTAAKARSMPVHVGGHTGPPGKVRFEIWPKVLEAAFESYAQKHGYDVMSDGANAGVPITFALKALTNATPYSQALNTMTDTQFFSVIGRGLNEQKAVVTSSRPQEEIYSDQVSAAIAYEIVPDHAYAVLGLNAKDGTVWLGDPQGKTLSVPMEVYRRLFNDVAWAYVP